MTDTSCSTDRLPKNTPTLSRSAMPCTCRGVTEDHDLPLEVHPELLLHGVMRDADERQHVRRSRVIDVDDEVRMLRRDLRAAQAPALEPRGLDEASCLVARRVFEDAAEAADAIWLRCLALRLDRVGALTDGRRFIGMHAQPRAHDHAAAKVVLETGMAIAEVALVRSERRCIA